MLGMRVVTAKLLVRMAASSSHCFREVSSSRSSRRQAGRLDAQ